MLRQILHGYGFRFRINKKGLSGTPDIALPRYKVAIFVHGCFWHQHTGCKKATLPKSNETFWADKLGSNVKRDKKNKIELERLGWKVYQIWECEILAKSHKAIDNLINDLKRKRTDYK